MPTPAPAAAAAAPAAAPAAPAADSAPVPRLHPRLLAGWALFVLLMLLVALQERWVARQPVWPWPAFDEASAMLGATLVAAWRWRRSARHDAWLDRPAQWFWRVMRGTPLVAAVFVAGVYGLRHAVRALAGVDYEHPAWPQVVAYEGAKFAVFYGLFSGVEFALRSHQALAAARLRGAELARLHTEARLAQLTQQMQPHLLFNALNTVAGLVHDDPDAAEAALLRLSALLRAATQAAQQPLQPLDDELALARHYAGLMQQRFGPQRLAIEWDVEALGSAERALPVPTLSLQPLLENAVVHAVERRRGLTTLRIGARPVGDQLLLSVADDGPGLLLPPTSADAPVDAPADAPVDGGADPGAGPPTPPGASPAGHGLALANLRERLAALYGPRAALRLGPRPGGGTLAVLEIPRAG